jgi:hypothetical protein
MTTQYSTKLAALGAALLINAMMFSSVAVLFGTQTHLSVSPRALVHNAVTGPIAMTRAQA